MLRTMTSNRIVVVTGGTGALGRANVRAFLDQGDRVVVPWIVKAERDEVADLWRAELSGDRLELIEADVTEESGAAAVYRVAPDAEALVNGVGGFEGGSPLHETDAGALDRMYRLNVRSAAIMSRAFIPEMLGRGSGSIVNVSSRAAFEHPPGLSAYSAAKAAVAVLTQTLQCEVNAGIRVNAVVPATIDTPANRRAMPDADPSTWTPPEQIAQVIVWLCSEKASAVRGALIPV